MTITQGSKGRARARVCVGAWGKDGWMTVNIRVVKSVHSCTVRDKIIIEEGRENMYDDKVTHRFK